MPETRPQPEAPADITGIDMDHIREDPTHMFAIAALVVFILGLILHLLGVGNEWLLLFLGLALLAAHMLWSWTPWTRTP